MPAPNYERLEQDDVVDSPTKTDFSALPLTRPETYYDDGPFDAPSSDSEDETLLEKGPPSPGATERGLVGSNGRESPLRKVS